MVVRFPADALSGNTLGKLLTPMFAYSRIGCAILACV